MNEKLTSGAKAAASGALVPRVVIVGAGFGGLEAAKALRKADVEVLLVDQHNYHTFQPLLYQVATAALEPEEIAHTVRGIYHGQENFNFRLAKVVGIDADGKRLLLEKGEPIGFDYLIVAAGATTNYFGIEGVEENAFPLKRVPDAINIRSHIMRQFERVDAKPDLIEDKSEDKSENKSENEGQNEGQDQDQDGVLTFVVVGGGPTGVEMAGALIELFEMVLRKDFPRLFGSRGGKRAQTRVVLVEGTNRLLTPFHEKSRKNALMTLRRRGVEVLLNEYVVRATADAVYLKSGLVIPTQTLIWAAGVRANPLADALGFAQTRGGRVVVNEDLSVPGYPQIFVIGDMAGSKYPDGTFHPQLAQVAMQGAKHVAKQIQLASHRGAEDTPGDPSQPFRYRDLGIMATIGRNAAVAELPFGPGFSGFIAWIMWLFLHLMYLVGFRNRLNVFINWMWNYFTYDRSARLILEVEPKEEKRGIGGN